MAEDEGIDVPSTDADDKAQGEVEGHEFVVEEFQADEGPTDVVCGAYFSSN
jgi:hypothetical protein